ncbi:MAG: zinc ribbon domain-containing protein [Anaerolineae bacterium]
MTSMVIVGALVLSVITIAFVLYPVFRARAVGRRYIAYSATGDRLADLIAQRDAIYEAIRDVDFDKETGKLTEEDYRLMRERLTAEGVRLLQELDRLMQADVREDLEREIEREVAALRRSRLAETAERRPTRREAPKPAHGLRAAEVDGKPITCHSCGGRVRAGVSFCAHCGVSLALTCPECGRPVQAGDRFCSRCGGQLSSDGQATEAIPADSLD